MGGIGKVEFVGRVTGVPAMVMGLWHTGMCR